MAKTRSTKQEIKDECLGDEENVECEVEIPSSDPSVAIKVVVANDFNFSNSNIITLPHPKSGSPALFRLSSDYFDEVLRVDEFSRSFFFGESVTEDGSFRIFSPLHPLFVALPFLYAKKEMFLELTELLSDENYPSISLILTNKQFNNSLELVADVKDVCDTTVVRFNEAKFFDWISKKFENLKYFMKSGSNVHSSIIEDDQALSRYVFGVLSENLSQAMIVISKEHLKIPDAPEPQKRMESEAPLKRKADDDYLLLSDKAVKKPKESVVKKQLQIASKGTKNIGSFFTKKV